MQKNSPEPPRLAQQAMILNSFGVQNYLVLRGGPSCSGTVLVRELASASSAKVASEACAWASARARPSWQVGNVYYAHVDAFVCLHIGACVCVCVYVYISGFRQEIHSQIHRCVYMCMCIYICIYVFSVRLCMCRFRNLQKKLYAHTHT